MPGRRRGGETILHERQKQGGGTRNGRGTGSAAARGNSMHSRHVLVSGKVQGVYFRFHAAEMARRFGLDGWVRNLPDGRVEALFAGDEKNVQAMLAWCRRGPAEAGGRDRGGGRRGCRRGKRFRDPIVIRFPSSIKSQKRAAFFPGEERQELAWACGRAMQRRMSCSGKPRVRRGGYTPFGVQDKPARRALLRVEPRWGLSRFGDLFRAERSSRRPGPPHQTMPGRERRRRRPFPSKETWLGSFFREMSRGIPSAFAVCRSGNDTGPIIRRRFRMGRITPHAGKILDILVNSATR